MPVNCQESRFQESPHETLKPTLIAAHLLFIAPVSEPQLTYSGHCRGSGMAFSCDFHPTCPPDRSCMSRTWREPGRVSQSHAVLRILRRRTGRYYTDVNRSYSCNSDSAFADSTRITSCILNICAPPFGHVSRLSVRLASRAQADTPATVQSVPATLVPTAPLERSFARVGIVAEAWQGGLAAIVWLPLQ